MGFNRYKITYECDCGIDWGSCGRRNFFLYGYLRSCDIGTIMHVQHADDEDPIIETYGSFTDNALKWDDKDHELFDSRNKTEELLTREIIEKTGFIYKDTSEAGLDYFWDKKTEKHSIIYDYKKHRMVITMRDEVRQDDYSAFIGHIFHHSQFRSVCRMVGMYII